MRDLLPNPYLLALGITLLAYGLISGLKFILTTRIARFIGRDQNQWDDIVVFGAEKTTPGFMIATALFIGMNFLKSSLSLRHYGDRLYFIIAMWQVAIWSHHFLELWIKKAIRTKVQRNSAASSSIGLIQLLARMSLFSMLFLFTLSNLGVQITTIIAGLGVGGIAVALALQRILGDLFSSLSIVLDRPFVVGDFIAVDQFLGEVEKIGLKTTRIRSLSGEQIIFSNSDLLAARIRNFKRMQERRVAFVLNLPLRTETAKIRAAVSLITGIIRLKKVVRFERSHFMRIGTTVELETVYWVLGDDYDLHMDIQQDILYDIKTAFEGEEISFAFPAHTVQVLPTEVFVRAVPASSGEMSKNAHGTIVS